MFGSNSVPVRVGEITYILRLEYELKTILSKSVSPTSRIFSSDVSVQCRNVYERSLENSAHTHAEE